MSNYQEVLEVSLQTERYVLKKVANEIKVVLNNALSNTESVNVNQYSLQQGELTTKNDYRSYFWIVVEGVKAEYWLTLFYNDIDPKTGNPHTVWATSILEKYYKNDKGKLLGPHHILYYNGNKTIAQFYDMRFHCRAER
jgi:hypothetical protein